MTRAFEIAGGTVTGQAHVASGRNGQDAFSWEMSDDGLVAVVCDGCGTAPHSEVGAKIGARLVAQAGRRHLASGLDPADLLEGVRREVLDRLRLVASMLGVDGPGAEGHRTLARTVLDYLLFTVVGAVVTSSWATTFALGDGLVVLNGERRQLGPFPGNEPPYLAYSLLGGGVAERRFEVHRTVPVEELQSLLLATDGAIDLEHLADRVVHGKEERVGELSQFWTRDRFFTNADLVRRRLVVASRGPRGGLLPDDTTVLAIRRKRAAA